LYIHNEHYFWSIFLVPIKISMDKKNYNNLGAFFRDLPEECPKLAPLLLYVNRPTIASFFRSNKNLTFLIPSEPMMSELKRDFESKNFKSLDMKILSLLIPEAIHSASGWQNVELTSGKTIVPIKHVSGNSVLFSNGSKAYESEKFHSAKSGVAFWELDGAEIPLGAVFRGQKIEKPKVSTGSFENAKTLIDSDEKKIVLAEYRKQNFKQLVCDLYSALDAENMKIADCFINGNPAAEFFLLFDSPFIQYDAKKFKENKVADCEKCYGEILKKTGEYLCNSRDLVKIDALRSALKDSHIFENEYKNFYASVEKSGEFEIGGERVKICHPALAKYLYSIELFCHAIKISVEELASAENPQEILDRMILFNASTNTRSTENVLFSEESAFDENLEEFRRRFEKCGLCLFKTIEGAGEAKIPKPKSRKFLKHRGAIKNMSSEQKKKLLKYLNSN